MDELGFLTALHRPGTLVDAGAHDGLLALPLARLPGASVLAFEPLPAAFARLAAACAGIDAITPIPQALGDAPGRLALSVPVVEGERQEQWASLVKTFQGHGPHVRAETIEVPVVTLDSFGLADLTAMKIDAEGAEYEVLRGARDTLRRCRPVLTLELEERHREGSTWAVPAFLDALDYATCFVLDGQWWPATALDRATMQRASPDPSDYAASDPYVFNFFAWPREREAEVRQALPMIRPRA
ncbi:FkbM family methyltransferase [Roseomonas marmotae]|uniref:FkbM family methyltransferase n=1 Tax=Roseomonas marmotae TaxID=2768161 RepID=A0ABS3KDD3_9PROT|nr:FkbM family methyltransferase [Roseomonas marmotae]MBO1075474.1 FkbM family methyltransferase [Roseomonas marmotae]QTI81423.1 FkbM family methyltransferase [Roseomonas marmotae]